MRSTLFRLFLAAAAPIAVWPAAGHAQPYSFTTLADTSAYWSFRDALGALAEPGINAQGGVAFYAEHAAPTITAGPFGPIARTNAGIFRSDGVATTTIATNDASGPFAAIGTRPALNLAGTTVFSARLEGETALSAFTGLGGAIAPVLFGEAVVGAPTINDSGTVAFARRVGVFVYLFPGGDGSDSMLVDDGFTVTGSSINASGEVAFRGAGGIRTSEVALIAEIVPFGELRNPAAFWDLGYFPTINDAGTVAFVGQPASLPALSGVYTSTGPGADTLIASTAGGAFSSFADGAAINNLGEVAFQATLAAGGSGIFTGPDPLLDKVIQVGDVLAGATVSELAFFYEGFNDAGQVAFAAALSDGREGIFRADPLVAQIPEPQAYVLLLAGLCLLGFAARRTKQGRTPITG